MSFTVYKSSAGSGKTFTLVKEYLKIVLLNPEKIRNILAITFTNKAANEMKERIINSLTKISSYSGNNASNDTILQLLISETNLDKEVIISRAGIVLNNILHNYSDFAISTIDSFVHKIIRTFAFDLHLPINFDVEMDLDTFVAQVVDLLISDIGNNDDVTRTFINFIKSRNDEDKTWHIEKVLQDFTMSIFYEDSGFYIDKIKTLKLNDFFEINSQINKFIKNFEDSISPFGYEALSLIDSKGIEPKSFYQGNKGIYSYFKNIKNKNFDKLKPNNYVLKTINEDKWYAGKTDEQTKSLIDSVKPQIIEIFNKIQKHIENNYSSYIIYKNIKTNIFSVALLNEIEKIINDLKSSNNIVLISEFNKKIAEIVLKEPVPFIYERCGEKYKHFLIDEFQDTSVLQWQNLLPLIDNSLSEDNYNMIVGDAKQAIYRWRNGEVEQFIKLPEIYDKSNNIFNRQRSINLKNKYIEKNLNNNFRSKSEIVKFNNNFFRNIIKALPDYVRNIYKNSDQNINTENKGGYINIDIIENKNANEFETENLNRIKKIIAELKTDNFDYKDIAILCRTNKQAVKIANFLIENDIDVISFESLLLSNSAEVNFIISCFNFINNTKEKIFQLEIINYLLQNKKLNDALSLHEYIVRLEKPLKNESNLFADNNIETNDFVVFLNKCGFKFSPSKLLKLSLYDICEEIIRTFELNKAPNPYIQFFLDTVYEFSLDNNNISDFLNRWEQKKEKLSIVVPEGINAVNILTIHKAKGLEFPVVILPFLTKHKSPEKSQWIELADKNIPNLKSALLKFNKNLEDTSYKKQYKEEKDKSLLDNVNILYVAMTRPVSRLYLLTSKPSKEIISNSKPLEYSNEFIYYYLNDIDLWDNDLNTYSFGIRTKNSENTKINSGNIFLFDKLISNDWRDKILLSTKAPDIWCVDDPQKNTRWGNIIHTALSQIKYSDDAEKAVDNLYFKGIIDKDEKTEILKKITEILNHPKIKPFFEKGLNIKNESEILIPTGKTYRPDRVIIKDNKAIVIDYKTGKTKQFHKKQIENYADILTQMNYNVIEKYLIYIDDMIDVVEV